MPYETGGRADKMGNRYEHNWIIYELIDVLREKVQSVTIEALGDEEEGVDLAVEPVCSHVIHDAPLAERLLRDLECDRVKIILDAVNLIDTPNTGRAEEIIDDSLRRLSGRTTVLHLKDFIPQPEEPRPKPVACGRGQMVYGGLLRLAAERKLPITLENTTPENAEGSRLFLERTARELGLSGQ